MQISILLDKTILTVDVRPLVWLRDTGFGVRRILPVDERFTQSMTKRVISMCSLNRGACTIIP